MRVSLIFVIILAVCVITFATVFVPVERFETSVGDVMTPDTETTFKDYEDVRCKFVFDRLGYSANNYDLISNYILVNDPKETDACYIKNSDVQIMNACSTANSNIYDPSFSNVVQDIYPKLVTDPYVAETIPQGACTIKFDSASADPDALRNYLSYVDMNLPKLQDMRNAIAQFKSEEQRLGSVIQETTKQLADLTATYDQMTVADAAIRQNISDQAASIAQLQNEVNAANDQVAALQTQIAAKKQQYQNVANLRVSACADADFKNCVYFPIGTYDVRRMELMGMANDNLSSIKVPQGLVARLYADSIDPDGNTVPSNKYIDIDGRDVNWIGGQTWSDGTQDPPLNDQTSSIVVRPKQMT